MTSCCNLFSFVWPCFFLMLVVVTVEFNVAKLNRCEINTCPGPLAHYKSLNCTPVYQNDECCPWRYDCDHWYARDRYYCHINNIKYRIGEKIRKEDANLCEENCTCTFDPNYHVAYFECFREKLCPRSVPSNASCYMRNSIHQCCPEEVCQPEDMRRSCTDIDLKEYLDGQYAVQINKPDLMCVCRVFERGNGFFDCKPSKRWFWFDIQAVTGFYKNCSPVYLPYTGNIYPFERITWRCQNAKDHIIDEQYSNLGESKIVHGKHITKLDGLLNYYMDFLSYIRVSVQPSPELHRRVQRYIYRCIFGDRTMHIGDQLPNITYDDNSNIVCTCEIPPVPTCVLRDKPKPKPKPKQTPVMTISEILKINRQMQHSAFFTL